MPPAIRSRVIQINDPAWGTFQRGSGYDCRVQRQHHHRRRAVEHRLFAGRQAGFRRQQRRRTRSPSSTPPRAASSATWICATASPTIPTARRHFQPRGLAVTADNTKLYVTRFLLVHQSRAGGRAMISAREGLVAVLDINTDSANIADYKVARVIPLAPQITGFKFPGVDQSTPPALSEPAPEHRHPRRDRPICPTSPLRRAARCASTSTPTLSSTSSPASTAPRRSIAARSTCIWARAIPSRANADCSSPIPGPSPSPPRAATGTAYVVSAASDLLVKVNVAADGRLGFTVDGDTTRYIDLNDPDNPATSGANAGKNPQGIAINSDWHARLRRQLRFAQRLGRGPDHRHASSRWCQPPTCRRRARRAKPTWSARRCFSPRAATSMRFPGTNSLRDRLSSEGWQSCASCHFKGLTDGVIWQFAAGPRKSVPLNATFNPHNRSAAAAAELLGDLR